MGMIQIPRAIEQNLALRISRWDEVRKTFSRKNDTVCLIMLQKLKNIKTGGKSYCFYESFAP